MCSWVYPPRFKVFARFDSRPFWPWKDEDNMGNISVIQPFSFYLNWLLFIQIFPCDFFILWGFGTNLISQLVRGRLLSPVYHKAVFHTLSMHLLLQVMCFSVIAFASICFQFGRVWWVWKKRKEKKQHFKLCWGGKHVFLWRAWRTWPTGATIVCPNRTPTNISYKWSLASICD